MRKNRARIWLSIFVCAAIAAVFAVWHFLDGGYIARRISAATTKIGATLTIREKPELSLFPPTLAFGSIGWQGNLGGIHIDFQASGGKVEISLPAFLIGRLIIRELHLDKPELVLTRTTFEEKRGSQGATAMPEIERMVVNNGAVRVETGAGSIFLDNLRLTVQNLRPRQESDLQCDFVMSWQAPNSAPVAGNLALRGSARYYAPNLIFRNAAATFTSTESGLLRAFSPLQARFEGAIDLDTLKAKIHAATLLAPELEITGAGEYIAGKFIGQSKIQGNLKALSPVDGDFSLQAQIALTPGALKLQNMLLDLCGCTGTGECALVFPGVGTSGEIAFDLNMGTLDAAKIKLVDAPKAGKTSLGKTSTIAWPRLNVRAGFERVRYGSFELAKPLLEASGAAGRYQLESFEADWANGAISITGKADIRDSLFSLTAKGGKISMGAALKQLGVSGFIKGPTDFNLRLEGAGSEPLHTLSGVGKLECRNLELEPLGEIALMLPLLGDAARKLPGSLRDVKISLSASDGILSFSPITASGPEFLGNGEAVADLKRDFLEGNFLVKTLGLDVPVAFSGPFGDVSWRVEPSLLKTGQGR